MRPADVLLSEPRPLLVRRQLALAVGLQEAIQLQQLHWLLDHFDARSVELDGRLWLRAELKFWREQFPWASESTIKRSFDHLVTLGLVERNRGREGGVYAIDYEAVDNLARSAQSELWAGSDCAGDTGQIDLAPCKREEKQEEIEDDAPADAGDRLFETAPPSPAEDVAVKADSAENIAKVWAHYVQVFDPARKDVTPSRERLIVKALKETHGDVELLCQAVDGLKSWRKGKPGDTSLSAIFATRPGGSALGDQIDFWASKAEARTGFDLSRIPSVMRATVNSDRGLVRKALASDDEHTRNMGREAAKRLQEKWNIVPIIRDGALQGWRYGD